MPSFPEIIGVIVAMIKLSVATGHRQVLWKAVGETRQIARVQARQEWGCPSSLQAGLLAQDTIQLDIGEYSQRSRWESWLDRDSCVFLANEMRRAGLPSNVGQIRREKYLIVEHVIGSQRGELFYFSSLKAVEKTSNPAAFANCSAKIETPPVPKVRIVEPGWCLGPVLNIAFQAVKAALGRVAASSNLR